MALFQAGADNPEYGKFAGGGLIRSHGGWEELSRLRNEHRSCIGDEQIMGDSHFVQSALNKTD